MDPEDGDKVTVLSKIRIRKAVVLKAREFRSFVYDLAFISANKDFTHGGFFDPEDRKIIIAAADVPKNFNPQVDDYVIFQNEKYEVKEIFHLEDNFAYGLSVRHLRGAQMVRIENALSVLNFTQEASSETEDRLIQSVVSHINFTQDLKEVP